MTYIEKLKELKQSAPTSWPELQDYCSVGYVIRQHKISGSVIRNTFIFFFYTSICIMLSLNRKKEDSGLKILIFISGGAQIRRHICIVDLYRWLTKV